MINVPSNENLFDAMGLSFPNFEELYHGTIDNSLLVLGRTMMWPVDPTVSKHPIAGYHHMGTTRMSAAPAEGVVVADCRVHGYANLYVAGSSVFATGSWANPTLTIIALALRLADRLVDEMARGADVPR
jgi:choline dehydrogenase-like flavoprotein